MVDGKMGNDCIYIALLSKVPYNVSAAHSSNSNRQGAVTTICSILGFKVLLEGTLRRRLEELGLCSPTLWLVDRPLYLLSHSHPIM